MTKNSAYSPSSPGKQGRWASAAKTGVGTALGTDSDVWFTISSGILTEIFHPFVDSACTRDLELFVTAGQDFYSEEKRDTRSEVSYLADGVPAFHVVNTCVQNRYRLEKRILTDHHRPTVLQQIHFTPLMGKQTEYSLYMKLYPHLGNQSEHNNAWLGDYKGVPMLFAQRNGLTLALACSAPWRQRSVGFVDTSGGWKDMAHKQALRWDQERAEDGNVVLMGEIDLGRADGPFLLALSFGRSEGEAGHCARASLLQGFEAAYKGYVLPWTEWQNTLLPLDSTRPRHPKLDRISAMVMRTHEDKHFPGAIVASLATPWGFSKGDGDLGYHRVWPRDLIQTVGGLLAIKKHEDARRVLSYLQVTQDADGHWPQNMFTNGLHSWNGSQLDETAFVILLIDLAMREHALESDHLASLWPMVRGAASYLVQHGPVTPLDRWEEEAGYFASTMAVEIPALLAAADLADRHGEPVLGSYLRETADAWNEMIDDLLYVTGTELARKAGVDGYYVRFAKPDQMEALTPAAGSVTIKNHPPGKGQFAVAEIVSPDALSLVRFGLRTGDDPRIVNTVRVIDMLLKVETPGGPCWHRYNHDGYGEHKDGAPFDGVGVGRVWPLLTGERAHYELAAGRPDEAEKLIRAMEGFANESGFLPEQIWDAPDIPEHDLTFGRPSGSAMPLVWAHAEYIKLRRSIRDGRVFDMPRQTVERYLEKTTESAYILWRFDQKCRAMPVNKILRLEVLAPAIVHWSVDRGQKTHNTSTKPTGLGVHVADLPTHEIPVVASVNFAFHWTDSDKAEKQTFTVWVMDDCKKSHRTETARKCIPTPT